MSKRKTYFTDSKNVDCQIKRNRTNKYSESLPSNKKKKTYFTDSRKVDYQRKKAN